MTSRQSTVDFILEQIATAGVVRSKQLFGGYGIFCNDRTVALVCDGQLFVKPTGAGRAFIGDCIEGYPYPGAKPWLLISGDLWDDHEWLSSLVRLSAAELPIPKKKIPRSKISTPRKAIARMRQSS
ncbi:MAG: TfoX/Sxy family protein [Acidiferrobacter sp.]